MEQVLEKPKTKKKKREKNVQKSNDNEVLDVVAGDQFKSQNEFPSCSKIDVDEASEALANAAFAPIVELEAVEAASEAELQIVETKKESLESTITEVPIVDLVPLEVASEPETQAKETPTDQVKEKPKMFASKTLNKLPEDFETLLTINKVLVEEIKSEQINETLKNLHKLKPITKNVIKPYTEAQLAALYNNSELEMIENFTNSFIDSELKGFSVKQHHLFELLSNYLHVREKITGNNIEIKQLRSEYSEVQNQLWTISPASISGSGQCTDGTSVVAQHSYKKATLHRSAFQTILRILNSVQKMVYENHILYSYSAEDSRLQIELYIQTIISNCINVTQIDKSAPISLIMQEEPPHLKPYLTELRLCISVLFAFQRKQIRDAQFLKESRAWLTRLVLVLLRVANFHDHLFLLHHILRCPPGVGTWASNFIQTPLNDNIESPFSDYQINHILTILSVILMPVKERDKFLEEIAQKRDGVSEALWIIVDSDGEEDEEPSGTSLRENDLVAIMNQLPLDNLFRSLLLVKKINYKDHYDVNNITEHHILRFLSFQTTFLKIIHKGLQTYNQPRYNQFSKRLSRLIRHVVQYSTDQWEHFASQVRMEDAAMLERLQIEYDSFFLRAVYYLYTAQKLGAWQFLAVVPYNAIKIETLWKVFYFLHNSDAVASELLSPVDGADFSISIWDSELRGIFVEKLVGLTDAECYYLLNTFANMALTRETQDMEFIRTAAMDLLEVGFVNENTREACSKSARILLTHITSKHPQLLSDILKKIKESVSDIGDLVLYLYEELPLLIWKLTDQDMEILSKLLMFNTISDNESKLARMIISRLNWDFENGSLFLPYEMHCDVAILAVRAADKEQGYLQWGWQTVMRLKLHLSDKGFVESGRIGDVERYDILLKGIRERQPLASFVSLLLTTWGHLVPLICTKGLAQLLLLQSYQKHEAVLFVLNLIIPMFIESQECIINCDEFQEILTNLLNADRGYISFAKSLISVQNTVLQQFGNMIETQIANFAAYGLDTPRCLVRLWINSLVSVPNWNKDNAVLYLLDVIVRASFFHADALDVVESILRDLLQCCTPQEHTGTISTLFKWVSNSSANNTTLISSSLSTTSWLAYVMIGIEHEEKERKTGLWKEVLTELNLQKNKVSVDYAIKKASGHLKLPSFTSGFLCIYRWAQQAMDSPVDHPILPLLWQKFFTLYLARIPVSSAIDKGCVGEKFFNGLVNFAFFKRIKRRLQETVEYYQMQVDSLENEDSQKKMFYQSCLRIFEAYLLWLEEPKLQESNLLLPSLPSNYEPNLLAFLLQGSQTPWFEYLDYDRIKTEQKECIRIWRVSNFREKSNTNQPLQNPGSRIESADPVERILRRLNSYDAPKLAPAIDTATPPVVPVIDFSSEETMLNSLNACFKTLKQFAHNHLMKVSEHKALDCAYQELIPQLYRSELRVVKKKQPCKGRNQHINCAGPAVIELQFQEARINERLDHQIQANRNAYESLLAQSLQSPSTSLCSASITIQEAVKILHAQAKCNPAATELGVKLFYYILAQLNEEISNYLPTKTLFSICLEKLGQAHIAGIEHEMPVLLERILKEPSIAEYLAPHFSPVNVSSDNLLQMYSLISKEVGKFDVSFTLLSKFDIEVWLRTKNPKLSQRSHFIEGVVKGLVLLGFEPVIEALMLHGLYRKHLLAIFQYQFPEHYGEVLITLLKTSSGTSSDSAQLCTSVWIDVLNSLAKPMPIHPKFPLRDQLRQYAQKQKVLQHQELLETAELLSKHFTQERLQYGLYGLYPKCRPYIDIYVLLLGMTGHALIISSLNAHQGLLADKLCEKIWPHLREIFSPWIVPYSMQNLKENMASWIQQLADDRSVLLPWIQSDLQFAQKIITTFYECIVFLIQTLPACNNILNFIWQWYVSCYAHGSVKEHIINPIHCTFMALPWEHFWPSITDLEFMQRVVDQYLPECHIFLGHIFISISWQNWLQNISNTCQIQVKARVYQCFLNLLVKLSNEPNIRHKHIDKIVQILHQSESLDWGLLEPSAYQHVLDWYILNCDSLVILKCDNQNVDFKVFEFLKVVSSFNQVSASLPKSNQLKRQIFVRSYVKLISVVSSRHKTAVSANENDVAAVIQTQLKHLDNVVQSEEEISCLLNEFLCIIDITCISHVAEKCFSEWIENKPSDGIVIKAMLSNLWTAVRDCDIAATLYELTLTSYFQNNVSKTVIPTWDEVIKHLKINPNNQTELERSLISKGSILTLNALLNQKMNNTKDYEGLLNLCLDWLEAIKISEASEPKVILLWLSFLEMALKHLEKDQPKVANLLYQFSQLLNQASEDKNAGGGWGRGLLNVIGINKVSVSLHFRFLCRALAGYVLAQLPDVKGEPQVVRHVANAPARVGQPGGNTECAKVLLKIDFGQTQGKIKDMAELALKQIQDANNSMHNVKEFLHMLVKQGYIKTYLKNES